MKKITIILILLIGCKFNSNSQTYYNPSSNVNIILTIKESYKPIDFGKIGRDFNTMIQNEVQRRENLKRYYDEIYYQTKNSIYSSTILTSDNLINSKISMLQGIIIEEIDIYNRSLKSGMMKPNEYESNVRNIYYTYMNTNQAFLQIIQYKYNRDLELGDQIKKNEFNNLYTNSLNSIEGFKINNSNVIEFILNGLTYPNKTSNFLYEFVRSSCEGNFGSYQEKFEMQEKKKAEEVLFQKNEYRRIYDLRRRTFDLREKFLSKSNENERNKFRKEEEEYIKQNIENLFNHLVQQGFNPSAKGNSFKEVQKNILNRLFKQENNSFEFEGFFYDWNKNDPLSNPNNFNEVSFFLDVLENFLKMKSYN